MPSPQRHPEKLMVLVAAYNEEGAIQQVITSVQETLSDADVVVIDDCSSDKTATLAAAAGVGVVCLPCNLGIGGAMQTGLKFARQHGYDLVVRLDGDGQHDPRELWPLITAVRSGQADIAFGSRFINNDYTMKIPFSRRLGIKTFAFLVSMITGQKATDTTSGFMCLNHHAINLLADFLPQDYPEVEGRIILHKAGLTTLELPAQMRERLAGISSIDSWRSIYYAFKVSISVLICAMKDIPHIEKESDHAGYTNHPASRRYRHQPLALVSDRTTDSEAQIT